MSKGHEFWYTDDELLFLEEIGSHSANSCKHGLEDGGCDIGPTEVHGLIRPNQELEAVLCDKWEGK